MYQFVKKRRRDHVLPPMTALAISTVLAACGGAPSVGPIPSLAPTMTPMSAAATMPAPMIPTSFVRTGTGSATSLVIAATAASPSVPMMMTRATTPQASASNAKPGALDSGALSACDVITKADVEAVLHTTVVMPPEGVPGAMPPLAMPDPTEDATSICIYVGQMPRRAGVMVSLGAPGSADPAGSHPLSQATKGSALHPLSGIGDEAVTDGQHIVITRKNGRQLAVIVQSDMAGDTASLEAGKQLAKIGADRL